jgi:hypothetical protein
VSLVTWLCSQMDQNVVLDSSRVQVSQMVLLCLIQQVCSPAL